MLNVMRENLRHLKWLLIVVAISMTLYLGDVFFSGRDSGGAAAPWAARVNDTEIQTRDFLMAARNINDYYANLFGDNFAQFKPQLRLGSQAIQQLISQQIQLDEARKLGFTASDQEVADLIRTDPRFQDAEGNFVGAEQYKQYFERQWAGGVEAFEDELAKEIISRKWADLVSQAVRVSPMELEDAYRQRNEKTRIRYVLVASADQPTGGTVPEEELQAWYDAHQDDYMRGVSRKIRYAVVERRSVLDAIEISDEQIQAYYDANLESYRTPEQRRASHILFQARPSVTGAEREVVRSLAQATLERIQAGESLADLAPELSADPGSAANGGDLGFFGRGAMVPSFEEAVFGTPVGELAGLVETDFGFHVIQVTGEREAGLRPLDDVREDIRTRISLDTAQDMIREKAESLAGAATDPDRFADAAREAGLEVLERTATQEDRMADLAPTPEFMREMFSLPVGSVSGPLGVARGLAVIAVDQEFPPAVAPLADVRNEVESAVRNERLRQAAATAAEKAFGSRRDLDRAARTLGAEIQDSGDLAPGRVVLPGMGGDSDELRAALFNPDVAVGDSGIVPVPSGALVYEVTDRTAFDPVAFEAARPALESELLLQKQQVHLQTILAGLQEGYEIEINTELIAEYDS